MAFLRLLLLLGFAGSAMDWLTAFAMYLCRDGIVSEDIKIQPFARQGPPVERCFK